MYREQAAKPKMEAAKPKYEALKSFLVSYEALPLILLDVQTLAFWSFSKSVRKVAGAAAAAILFYDFETFRFLGSFSEIPRCLFISPESQTSGAPRGPRNRT